jgi:hypothetical protein
MNHWQLCLLICMRTTRICTVTLCLVNTVNRTAYCHPILVLESASNVGYDSLSGICVFDVHEVLNVSNSRHVYQICLRHYTLFNIIDMVPFFYHCMYGCMFCMLLFNFVNYVFYYVCSVMYILFSLCCSMYYLCVNVYCTTATGCQRNFS